MNGAEEKRTYLVVIDDSPEARTALHFAARQGSAAAARALVEGGVDVNQKSPGDAATPLLVAIINGHLDLAVYFIEHGANPNVMSDAGVSPLYAALNVQWAPIAAYPQPRAHLQQARTYLDVMTLLLDKGADPNACAPQGVVLRLQLRSVGRG